MYPWSRPGSSREQPHHTVDSAEEMFRREVTEAIEARQQQIAPRRNKRSRSAFSTDQVNFLEMEFQKFPYITSTQRREVADVLGISEKAVKVWFQNRRMREKKDLIGNSESDDQNNRIVDLSFDDANDLSLSMRSMNELPDTLPDLTVKPSVNNIGHVYFARFEPKPSEPDGSRNLNYYNNIVAPLPELTISRIPKPQPSTSYVPDTSQLNYRSSAEFSIDLCKKYKSIVVTEIQSKIEDRSLQSVSFTTPRVPPLISISKTEHQTSPEDLSCNKSTATTTKPSPIKKVITASPGPIPIYGNYAPPYMPAANMLWKPANVMPIMSTGRPPLNVPSVPLQPVQSEPSPLPKSQEQSTVKKKCNCNCHVDASPNSQPQVTSSNYQAPNVSD